MWDPGTYDAFADERSRPFFDLTARIGAVAPMQVVDLGCGTGALTVTLAERWPDAAVVGVDSSPDMLGEAHRHGIGQRLRFELGDAAEWQPSGPLDVMVSNAVLHWVPGHRRLLARYVGWLTPGGWLAFQVPGNFDRPSHVLVRELCASPRWRRHVGELPPDAPVADPVTYASDLADLGCAVDAWETTYLHVLTGDDPVLGWISGTALRPILDQLGPEQAAAFTAELAPRLRQAYPSTPHGTPFPFRRIFVVAHRQA